MDNFLPLRQFADLTENKAGTQINTYAKEKSTDNIRFLPIYLILDTRLAPGAVGTGGFFFYVL